MQRILKICQQSSSRGDLLEEELVNSGASEIAIYLRTYLRASFHRSSVNRLRARSALISMNKPLIAETRFVWAMVILSSIKASGPLLNGRTLKTHS